MSCLENKFTLFAGEITTKRVTVREPKENISDPDVPVDLTGAEVIITCKTDTSQTNAEAVVYASQTVHTDPTNGITDLDFDFTAIDAGIADDGANVICDLWIIDSLGQRLPQGTFEGEIVASPTKYE